MPSIISSMRGLSRGRTRKLRGYSSADQPKLCSSQQPRWPVRKITPRLFFSASRKWARPTSSYSMSWRSLSGVAFGSWLNSPSSRPRLAKLPRNNRFRPAPAFPGKQSRGCVFRCASDAGQKIASRPMERPTEIAKDAAAPRGRRELPAQGRIRAYLKFAVFGHLGQEA